MPSPTAIDAEASFPDSPSERSSKSGRTVCRKSTAPVVMIASPMPTKACTPAMAGSARFRGKVPERANSTAVAMAATSTDSQAATKAPAN
jgi:hypothetical protein